MLALTVLYYAALLGLLAIMLTTDETHLVLAMLAFFIGTTALSIRATKLMQKQLMQAAEEIEQAKNISKKVS